jgi:hypothetical protein
VQQVLTKIRDPYKLFCFPDTVYLGRLFSNQEEKKEDDKMTGIGLDTINTSLVNHPDHYNKEGRKECWDEMIDLFGYEAVAIFDILSAYKYYYRAGSKDGNSKEQDLAKSDQYMSHSAEMIVNYICTNEEWSDKDILRIGNKWTTMDERLKEVKQNG